jgi:NADH-quinone oxidoreductase subunit N
MAFLQTFDAAAALPEIVLAVLAMALLMYGVFRKEESYDHVTTGSLAAIAIAAVLVLTTGEPKQMAFGEAFVVDAFARIMKVLALFGSAIALVLSSSYMKREKMARFEYPVLVLLASIGMMAMISANNLIALYMGLELQSLALYVVAAINRDSARSSEAGLKYFVLGALSSGMLLYGASLIYGFTGTTDFARLATLLAAGSVGQLGLVFGLVFVLAGLAFKISAVPFHMWTPDVYEGSPTPVTAFFAAAPKVAAMALLVRVAVQPFAGLLHDWQQVLTFVAIASMLLGAFAAIGQTNIKRLLAYSSIGHMGYALVGLAPGSQEGVRGVVAYIIIYSLSTLAVFACVLAMKRRDQPVENIADLAGLGQTNKALAFVFSMLMFSLAGIPPLAGFFAKVFVFLAAVKSGLYILAVIGVLSSVVGAYYYLRIVKIIYFDEPAERFDPMDGEVKLVAYAGGAFVLLFVVFVNYVLAVAETAAQSLL